MEDVSVSECKHAVDRKEEERIERGFNTVYDREKDPGRVFMYASTKTKYIVSCIHACMQRNKVLTQNQNDCVISSCVRVCKTHTQCVYVLKTTASAAGSRLSSLWRLGLAQQLSKQRLCNGFRACEDSDQHVVCSCEITHNVCVVYSCVHV